MQGMLLALTLTLGMTAVAQQPTTAASAPTFEVATIKPSAPGQAGRSLGWNKRRFWAHDTTLTQMVQFAYNVHARQIVDEPAWFDNETFDIEAQVESGEPSVAQWHTVLQRLLADRLGMTLHHEERVMPA